MMKIPQKLSGLPDSMIRRMTIEAHRYDAINMGQGFPEFVPPDAIVKAAHDAVDTPRVNQYSEDRGVAILRETVSKRYAEFCRSNFDPETEVTILCGVTEAIVASILATVEVGDKVAIIEPAHENYLAAARFAGGVPIWITLRPPNFALDGGDVEKACKAGARAIIINTPHNPTGRVFSEAELSEVARLCVKYDVIAITDEIYEHIIYDGRKHVPLHSFSGMRERTITTSGIGKAYSLTGWRVGYALASAEITHLIRRVHTYLTICAPTPFQRAACVALSLPRKYYSELVATYEKSRAKMMEVLATSGFVASAPEGAYYVMADFSKRSGKDDVEFAMELVSRSRVAVIPGSSFYANPEVGRKLVRFAFPKPVSVIEEVGRRLLSR